MMISKKLLLIGSVAFFIYCLVMFLKTFHEYRFSSHGDEIIKSLTMKYQELNEFTDIYKDSKLKIEPLKSSLSERYNGILINNVLISEQYELRQEVYFKFHSITGKVVESSPVALYLFNKEDLSSYISASKIPQWDKEISHVYRFKKDEWSLIRKARGNIRGYVNILLRQQQMQRNYEENNE
jgi:hypothetical protein